MIVGIGQIMELTNSIEVNTTSGKRVRIDAGTKFYIRADKQYIIFENGHIMKLPKDFEVDGFSAKGITSYMLSRIEDRFPLDDMLWEFGIERDDFITEMIRSLEELSFYSCKGSID